LISASLEVPALAWVVVPEELTGGALGTVGHAVVLHPGVERHDVQSPPTFEMTEPCTTEAASIGTMKSARPSAVTSPIWIATPVLTR